MSIMRVKARWTIPGAGTAFTVLHFGNGDDGDPTDTEASNAASSTRTFFDAIKGLLPNPVAVDVMTDVEIIDVASGNLIGVQTASAQAQVTGLSGTGATWSAPSGACVTWNTAGLRQVASKPRRVRGRTFIVPLSSTAYDTAGNLSPTALTTLNNAATALRGNFGNQNLGVYGRPGIGGAPAGVFHSVTGHRITDQSAVLRSRRS